MKGAGKSDGEAELLLHIKLGKLPQPVREHPFAEALGRAWRFDFAWPDRLLALEVEGAVHRIKGRFTADLEKYLTAQALGWQVLRVSPKMISAGLALDILSALLPPARSRGADALLDPQPRNPMLAPLARHQIVRL